MLFIITFFPFLEHGEFLFVDYMWQKMTPTMCYGAEILDDTVTLHLTSPFQLLNLVFLEQNIAIDYMENYGETEELPSDKQCN